MIRMVKKVLLMSKEFAVANLVEFFEFGHANKNMKHGMTGGGRGGGGKMTKGGKPQL